MKNYRTVAPIAPTVTEQPARLSPVEHAGQAAVGVVGGGALVILALLATGAIGLGALPLAGGVVLALSASGFIVLAGGSLAHLVLYIAETLSKRDIDGDGYQGEPPKTFINPYQGRRNAQQDVNQEWRNGLTAFIQQCEQIGTGGPAWEKKIGRRAYEDYRNTLLGAGFAVWLNERNHLQGWKLVTDAESIVGQIFDAPHPTGDSA